MNGQDRDGKGGKRESWRIKRKKSVDGSRLQMHIVYYDIGSVLHTGNIELNLSSPAFKG